MRFGKLGSGARLGLVGTAAIFAGAFLGSLPPVAHPPVAEASVSADKDRDKDKKDKNSDHDADHVLNGQVLELDTLKDPPEMTVGSVDGPTVVRVLKTDEIAKNGVGVGDYVELTGEKINEQLFEATEISVSEHYKDPESDNDNKR
jgi:hypothetical protein